MRQDSSWVIPTLRCTSPADVYLLLKSSDFVLHDLDPELAFEGCTPTPTANSTLSTMDEQSVMPSHQLELVLKKWYSMDRGREFRCFVRNEILLGEQCQSLTSPRNLFQTILKIQPSPNEISIIIPT